MLSICGEHQWLETECLLIMHGYYLCILVMDKLTLSVNRGNRNSILQIWNVILSIYSVEVLEVPCLIKEC